MELDELIRDAPAPPEQVVEGVLVLRAGERWARVDGQAALWGPLVGAEHLGAGDELVLAQVQDGTPFVIYPAAGSGGGEPVGADKTHVHVQGAPSALWTVTHGLGKWPAVDVVDTGDSAVIPSVHYDDLNTVTLTFGSPTSGKAFLN